MNKPTPIVYVDTPINKYIKNASAVEDNTTFFRKKVEPEASSQKAARAPISAGNTNTVDFLPQGTSGQDSWGSAFQAGGDNFPSCGNNRPKTFDRSSVSAPSVSREPAAAAGYFAPQPIEINLVENIYQQMDRSRPQMAVPIREPTTPAPICTSTLAAAPTAPPTPAASEEPTQEQYRRLVRRLKPTAEPIKKVHKMLRRRVNGEMGTAQPMILPSTYVTTPVTSIGQIPQNAPTTLPIAPTAAAQPQPQTQPTIGVVPQVGNPQIPMGSWNPPAPHESYSNNTDAIASMGAGGAPMAGYPGGVPAMMPPAGGGGGMGGAASYAQSPSMITAQQPAYQSPFMAAAPPAQPDQSAAMMMQQQQQMQQQYMQQQQQMQQQQYMQQQMQMQQMQQMMQQSSVAAASAAAGRMGGPGDSWGGYGGSIRDRSNYWKTNRELDDIQLILNQFVNSHAAASAAAASQPTQSPTAQPIAPLNPFIATTVLTQPAFPGDTLLHLTTPTGVQAGMDVVIDQGPTMEKRTIAGLGSIYIDQPLVSYHPVGTQISVYLPGQAPTPGPGPFPGSELGPGCIVVSRNEVCDPNTGYMKTDHIYAPGQIPGQNCIAPMDMTAPIRCSATATPSATPSPTPTMDPATAHIQAAKSGQIHYMSLTNDELLQLFNTFKMLYNRSYMNTMEENRRFQIFLTNLDTIDKMNDKERAAGRTPIYGITQIADMTQYEAEYMNSGGGSTTTPAPGSTTTPGSTTRP